MDRENDQLILVTGANGFVGRHVVTRLAAAGKHLRAMVRHPEGYTAPAGAEVVGADLTQPDTLRGALTGVAAVVHCAAVTANIKEAYPGAYREVNGRGMENLVGATKAAKVKRLVVLSGLGTRAAKPGSYLATRWAMEEAVRNSGIPYVILQPSVQFGDGAEFVAALARVIRKSPLVPAIGGGKTKFQPIWVEDVVTCVVKSLGDDGLLNRSIPIGGSEQLTFKEILRAIAEASHKRRLILPLPIFLASLQARLFTKMMAQPPLTPATLELFSFDNMAELDGVERTFGFQPRGFSAFLRDQGIKG